MICIRKLTPAGVMFAVVAVKASATSRGPAANAFDAMNEAAATMAHAASKLGTNRL
jgi:hypothetical protein